jgi:hypothetical protein
MKDSGSAASNKCDDCGADMLVISRYVLVDRGVRQKNWNGSAYVTPVFGNLERKCPCGKHTALILDNLLPVEECEQFRDEMCSKYELTERPV